MKKIAKTERSYKRKLANDDTPLEELEALESDLNRYKADLQPGSKELKNLQEQLPQKEQKYNEAKQRFISEAVPEINSMLDNLEQQFQSFVSANEDLKGLRSDLNTTPLPADEFPDLPSRKLKSIANVLEYKREQWQKWSERNE